MRTLFSLAAVAGIALLAPIRANADVNSTSIAGHVYNDANGNGSIDTGETPLTGVQVNLYDSANNLVATTYTGPGGDHTYTFSGLTPGTYTVKLPTLPSGYTATNAIPGMESSGFVVVSVGSVGVKVSNTGIQIPALTDGDMFTPNDFLITQQAPPPPPPAPQPVNICGVVYRDINCNGTLQSGEPGLSDVELQLVDGSGNIVATADTDINGNYCFMNEPVGTYTIRETVPCGLTADNALPGTAATPVNCTTLKVAATTGGTSYVNENFLLCLAKSCSPFVTFTQREYGTPINCSCLTAWIDKFYTCLYPNGLTIGRGKTITYKKACDIVNFLPQCGTPGQLTHTYINPTCATEAGSLAGEVTALQLNVDISDAGATRCGLADLQVTCGPLCGYTVAQVLYLANGVLGGTSALPSGVSLCSLNNTVAAINSNFWCGCWNGGCLR